MQLTTDNKLKHIIIVGDRVLIKPKKATDKTTSGIYLPPGVQEKEKTQSGYIVKTGPGYPMPIGSDEDDSWKPETDRVRYIPLQVKEGDMAVFLQKEAFEVVYEGDKYFIVPQNAILMLEREENLFD